MTYGAQSIDLQVTVTDAVSSANAGFTVMNPDGGGPLFAVQPYSLKAAPNPFSGFTLVSYTLNKEATALVEVFSSERRRLAVLAQGRQKAGKQEYRIEGGALAAGTYHVEITVVGDDGKVYKESLKLILTR